MRPRVAVVGAGAVGCYFGGMLARAGVPVVLIGRPAIAEAVRRNGLFLDCLTFQERVNAEVSTELSAAKAADIVLFCVKTLDTETAAKQLAPHLEPEAIVVSMQHGVDNAERMQRAAVVEIRSVGEDKAALVGPMNLLQQRGPGTSSTAQDLARGKRPEIDSLNGYVSRKGAQLGGPTPVNYTLYTLVKLAEENL